jgi:cellulose synthase/poly-beta-1,6-N-acetylglucosamine synthase-like glycosyltransferase
MTKHSLFFQGNDVELGLLADLCGYNVGHVPFVVPTTVPSKFRAWFRQRKAWSGGEFRVMIVNWRVSLRHPFLYLYGAIVVILLLPLRWYYLVHPSWPILDVMALYLAALIIVNWGYLDLAILVYPIYSLLYTLVLVPIGIWSYVEMAVKYRNAGIINPHRRNLEARARNSNGPPLSTDERTSVQLVGSDADRGTRTTSAPR